MYVVIVYSRLTIIIIVVVPSCHYIRGQLSRTVTGKKQDGWTQQQQQQQQRRRQDSMPAPSSSNRLFGRNQVKSRKKKIRSRWVVAAVIVLLYLAIQLYLVQSPVWNDDIPLIHQQQFSSSDAYFNNVPVRLRDASSSLHDKSQSPSFHSSVHCVGETHDPATAWKHRSCSYVHLCLDLGDGEQQKPPEFFLVASPSEDQFLNRFRSKANTNAAHGQQQYRYSSTEFLGSGGRISNNNSTNYSPIDVALGGINPSWRAPPKKRVPYQHGIDKIRWAPKVYDTMPFEKYYELDPSIILVPYHSFAAANIGHLLWDDFLPLYNLLKIFGYEKKLDSAQHNGNNYYGNGNGYQHLLLRVDTMPDLFGSCDLRAKKKEACKRNLERFLPLFGIDPNTFSTLTEAKLTKTKTMSSSSTLEQQRQQSPPKQYPICAKRAVAGLGWLTDHGIRNHGWMANHEEDSLDVALARNVGRGPELYSFRNFLLRNLGFEAETATSAATLSSTLSFRILLSAHSSNHPDRSFGLQVQQKALVEAFPNLEVAILDLSTTPLLEQISLVSNQPPKQQHFHTNGQQLRYSSSSNAQQQHTIFVSACGGGSATAYFLPRGSSLVLYYNETGGMDYFSNENKTGGQALLDWDLMNNLGYLKIHWLPIGFMDEREGLDALVALIKHEMDGIINGLV